MDGYREEVRLDNGAEIVLRLVRPEDKELLVRGFQRLSPASRYRRFLTEKDHLTAAELRYLTEVDGIDHFALGATQVGADGAEEGIAVARFVRLADAPSVAEPALAVMDDYQGKGLGRILCRRLVEAARERGIERFRCEVLSGNQPMRALLANLGPVELGELGDEELMLEVPIGEETDGAMTTLLRSLERLLALVAQGMVRVRHALGRHRDEAQAGREDETEPS